MIVSLFSSGGGGTYDVKLGVALPTVDDTGLVYDGTSKEPTIGSYSTELMTVTYTAQTNAGTYQVHCSLNDPDHYAWLNTIQSTDQDIPWTIARATGAISVSPNAVEVGEEDTKTVTVMTSESTTVSALSSDTSVATVSVSGNIVSITDGGSEGTATITVSAADSTNYTYGTATVSVVVQYLTIVTWGGGTDEQIVKMCAASDEGKLNLFDCWNIGDKRNVQLSAMAATGVGESHRAQTVVMVIVNKGGYQKTTDGLISAFIVQQENCLSSTDSGTTSDSERGYMNSSNTNSGSWNGCARRTWCNNVYYIAIPSTLRSIFKQVNVKTIAAYNGSTIQTSNDYFFLPAAAEVFKGDSTYGTGGTAGQATAYSNLTEFNALSRWQYYETTSNRVKKQGTSGAANNWWERSPYYDNDLGFCGVSWNNVTNFNTAKNPLGLAPCGCIGTANDGAGTVIPSWSDGTDEEIVAAVASADAGNINLADFWNVGDKRAVQLDAMEATGVGESHRAQTVYMVLVDANNTKYPYNHATSGRTYCNFVVQQENCLASTDSAIWSDSEKGYINSTSGEETRWSMCARRSWCNDVYRNAIPSTLRNIFKEVIVLSAYNGTSNQYSDDYFFLPAAAEVYKGDSSYGTGGNSAGQQTTAYSNLAEFNALTRWKYYETAGNRIKKLGLSGNAYNWWERSSYYSASSNFCVCSSNGTPNVFPVGTPYGIAPAGCI